MAAPKHAVEFDKIIDAGRERKKNEALAARIFNRDGGRRSSTPVRTGSPGAGSLASRVGVKKRPSSTTRTSAGNVHGEWTHDLHNNSNQKGKQPAPNSLASRIHAPGIAAPSHMQANKPKPNRAAKLAQAYNRTTSSPTVMQNSMNVRPGQQQQGLGMSIRGLAGPFTIMAQNFAPGTTAADIESAMTPVGGLITTCRLVKAHPIVIAEIVFENREGAERVIQTFNNQNADGRTLHVYAKPGISGSTGTYSPAPGNAPSAPRALRSNGNIVDGSMGFDDPMEGKITSQNTGRGRQGHSNSSINGNSNKNGLYSDSMVVDNSIQSQGSNRRGRGFKSRGGGAGR